MTLQNIKSILLADKNYWGLGSGLQSDAFEDGFDAADPIGFLVFSKNVALHGYTYNTYWKKWQGLSIFDTITTEDLYLKFIEYKQSIKNSDE